MFADEKAEAGKSWRIQEPDGMLMTEEPRRQRWTSEDSAPH